MANRTYEIKDTMVVVALTKLEAKALFDRTQQHTGIRKSAKLVTAEVKLKSAMDAMDDPLKMF